MNQPMSPWDPAMAAGIAQQPLAPAGQPQADNSFASMLHPPPMQAVPPASPEEATQREAGWTQHLNELLQSPEVMMIGYAMMNGVPLGQAMMAAQAYKMFEQQNASAEAQKQQEFEMKRAESEANIAQSNASAEASRASAEGQRANADQTRVETKQKEFQLQNAPTLLNIDIAKANADIAQSKASATASYASAGAAAANAARIREEIQQLRDDKAMNAEVKKVELEKKQAELRQAQAEADFMEKNGMKMGTPGTAKGGLTADQQFKHDLEMESGKAAAAITNTMLKEYADANPELVAEIEAKKATKEEKIAALKARFLTDPANASAMQNAAAAGKIEARAKRGEK